MKNYQEALLKAISTYSLGADCVFDPLDYRRSNGTREPADLVWVCNNCLIMMYLKHKKPKSTIDGHIEMRRKLIRDNIKQAKGWLSEWRSGQQNLKGQNGHRVFDVKHSDYKYIYVISVLDCGPEDTSGIFLLEETKQLNVTACASIPGQVLLEITRNGGGIPDILCAIGYLIDAATVNSGHWNIVEYIQKSNEKEKLLIDPEMKWLKRGADFLTGRIADIILTQKSASNSQSQSIDISQERTIGSILNDLLLIDIYNLIYLIRKGIFMVGPNHEKTIKIIFTGPSHYALAVSVTVLVGNDNFLKNNEIPPEFTELIARPDILGSLWLVWDSETNHPILQLTTPLKGITNSERISEIIVNNISAFA